MSRDLYEPWEIAFMESQDWDPDTYARELEEELRAELESSRPIRIPSRYLDSPISWDPAADRPITVAQYLITKQPAFAAANGITAELFPGEIRSILALPTAYVRKAATYGKADSQEIIHTCEFGDTTEAELQLLAEEENEQAFLLLHNTRIAWTMIEIMFENGKVLGLTDGEFFGSQ